MQWTNTRALVPAKKKVEELSGLADLEKVSLLTYNVMSEMGGRKLEQDEFGYVDPVLLRIARRRELLLR